VDAFLAFDRIREFAACAWSAGDGWNGRAALLWHLTRNLRVRLGLGGYRPLHISTIPTRFGPLHVRENFGDITNVVDLLYHDVYRVRALAAPGAIFDAGANVGIAAMAFASCNPGRPVYCFEPVPENAALIRLNCPGAEIIGKALGSEPGAVRLHVDPDNVIASRIDTAWKTREVEFEVITLDDFKRERGIDEVALLKLDVEGMEVDILDGASATLRSTAEVVLESHGRERHQGVQSRLKSAGFRIDGEVFDGKTGFVYASRE